MSCYFQFLYVNACKGYCFKHFDAILNMSTVIRFPLKANFYNYTNLSTLLFLTLRIFLSLFRLLGSFLVCLDS